MGMNSSNGEIIEVEGGHIVRSSNRKDRHSKVYTSKGPRDRRVRLSAHTAIEFYDVQDRLGYDRPSKAVDWLMKKAKTAIDNLAELPPWHPSTRIHDTENAGPVEMSMGGASEYQCQIQGPLGDPNPLDPMKSLFPKCSSESNSMNFHGYPPELMAKTTNEEEDLCLSLHPFEDPQVGSNQHGSNDQNLFAGSASMRFQRMLGWENGGDMQHRGGGFIYNSPPNPSLHQLIGQSSQFSHQRGPLQFSVPIASSSSDHYSKQEAHQSPMPGEYAGFPHTPDPQRGRGWGGSS